MTSIHSILKRYWGYDSFRPLQEEIINTVLERKDCLALMPTGGGKSLCFQVPALAIDGLCLVISPLIALMKDQVENLRKKNVTAFAIHSAMTRKEVMQTLAVAGNSNCKFLYVSPERLETKMFKEYLLSLGVSMIAVDEAHCISQWGYDFRPSYLRIAALREELPDVPVLALTASATPAVQEDICNKLLFKKQAVFRQSFERPNLSYSAFNVSSKIGRIVDIIKKVPGTGIVYCRSRKRTKEISDQLNLQDISADYYHAGLMQAERAEKQENWIANKTRVIVCTNAFGMGIDKPDVRFVIHADLPDCLENYYQEAGRAGRDGKRSYAVLLFNETEIEDLKKSVGLRFPDVSTIRKIYQALVNYLQIPSGYGEGNYYAFDLATFLKNFSLDKTTVTSVVKTLEQEEHLYFNEQVFVPSKLQVTGDRETLESIEISQPEMAMLVKTLLRSYEGIIDQPVNINEKYLASLVRSRVVAIQEQLKVLHSRGVVRYSPQKEDPQVYLLRNRVKAEDLTIDIINYKRRREQFEARVDAMTSFARAEYLCRSAVIGKYFGDDEISRCGICDNCLNAKRKPVEGDEFEQIHQSIMHHVKDQPVSLPDLLTKMGRFSREKTKEVISYLQSEQLIDVSDVGLIKAGNTREK